MWSKNTAKGITNFLAWLGLNLCSLTVRMLPARWLYSFARFISLLGYRFAFKQKKIALESLKVAFGQEKSRQEIVAIAKDCFNQMANSAVELLYLMGRPQILKIRVRFKNEDYLKAALDKGKGVILVSAHFGNFPLLLARLRLEGYPVAGIMRPMRNLLVERIFMRQRNRLGIKTIYSQPRSVCVESTIKSLRNNEIVFIPLDQNFGTGGVFVDFFGRKAATATGPVVLAQRTKASIVPCFIVREQDNTHTIIFEPEIKLQIKENSQSTILANVQVLTEIIEDYIRKYPAQWGWIHRRWKSSPQQ